jgi:hypothetical protein
MSKATAKQKIQRIVEEDVAEPTAEDPSEDEEPSEEIYYCCKWSRCCCLDLRRPRPSQAPPRGRH